MSRVLYEASDFPILQNRVYRTRKEAMSCPRGDILLVEDEETGLIYNDAFRSDLMRYDANYNNEQANSPFFQKHLGAVKDIIRQELGDQSLVEVGCGKGAFSSLLKTKDYTGIEFSENARNIGRSLGRNIITESIEDHANSNEGIYDVVCSFQVVEHTSNPRTFIEGCTKALKPGGTLILTTPAEDSFLQYIQDFALNMPPHHVTKWTDKCLTNLENQFNIKCVHLAHEPLNSFHIPWYFTSMVVHQLNKTLGISHSLIKCPRHLVSHGIANVLYKLLGKDLPSVYQGHGHTVIAVYKKSANGHPK